MANDRREPSAAASAAPPADERPNDRQRRQQNAQLRAQLKPLRDAVRKAETALERAQQQKARIDEKLADPTLYEPAQKDALKRVLLDKARCEQEMETAETEWLLHSEALEQAERVE